MSENQKYLGAAAFFFGLMVWVLYNDGPGSVGGDGYSSYARKRDSKTKKNPPNSRCLYTMEIAFKRGGKTENKQLMAEAHSMSEAHSKFQATIDKSLRGATIEKMRVEKSAC